ncbi:MAG: class I SAM-dependent methyltransferase [Selenomonadaceae bacterium]
MENILDACCGSRMFWFDKNNKNVLFMDKRDFECELCDGRKLEVRPDVVGDFRNIPFDNNTFNLVVFDPPHLIKAGDNSWLAKKYGKLGDDWEHDIRQGFTECMRVLKPFGVLIFKWNEQQIQFSQIKRLFPCKPLFGNRRSKTFWVVFMKGAEE